MTIFCGCTAENNALKDKIAEKYASLTQWSAALEVSFDHGGTVTEYGLIHEYSEAGHTITVTSPEELAGLETHIASGTAEISYQGRVLAIKAPEGLDVSPVLLITDAFEAMTRSAPVSVFGNEAEFISKATGREITYRIVFAEDAAPISAAAFYEGRKVCQWSVTARGETDQN